VVIPIYNEAPNILPLARRVISMIGTLQPDIREVIWVNDGSRDGSGLILEALADLGGPMRALHLDHNHGQSAALAAGFRAARGDWVVTMDGDLQNAPEDIGKLLAVIGPDIGCVAGYRVQRNESCIRRISSKIANAVRNRLSDESIQDTGCSLKLFRKLAVDQIKFYDGMHRFLPTLVKMEGWNVVEVPVSHFPRYAGMSKYGIRNRLFKSFWDLLAVRWMKKRRLDYRVRDAGEPAS
jgi:glycosyltransferase involved in cell wall biosynthesis